MQRVARGWESQLRIAVDELVNFGALLPLINAFDQLQSGVQLRFTHESVGGTWEALHDGRADLVVAATNEPPAIAGLKWFELDKIEWVFAVSPHHPLAKTEHALTGADISRHRSVVVADSARYRNQKTFGVQPGQSVLAVPGMKQKIAAQRVGLGCGWLPRRAIMSLLASGELVAPELDAKREPNILYVGWIDNAAGRALQWWTSELRNPRLTGLFFGSLT